MKLVWKQRTEKVRQEMADVLKQGDGDVGEEESNSRQSSHRSELDDCVLQIQNCLELLLPSPENFLHDEVKDTVSDSDDDETPGGDGREHGMLDMRKSIKVRKVHSYRPHAATLF